MATATLAIALTGLVAITAPPAQAAVIGDNYPAYLANAKQDALIDPWRFYNRECTSFVAWRLNNTNGVPFTNQYLGADLWWGNANTWGTSARAKGVLVDNTPAVGSVAWSTAGKYGHVAWVADVLDDGRVVVEEYNWGTVNGEKGRYRYRTSLASAWTGFIHIKDMKSWPPSDGAFINVKETGEVYRIAGGAPIYVSNWAIYGGPQYTQTVTKAKFDTLPKLPKNGTYIRGQASGDVYSIAHGAPIHVASWAGVGGEKPTIGVDDAAIDNAGGSGVWRFLRAVPTDGFLRGAESFRIFRLVAGRPYYVSSWAPYGGEQPFVTVHDASIDGCNHMNCDPVGALDKVTGGRGTVTVSGWAQDPNATAPLTVHIYVDGVMAGSVKTSGTRTDIEKQFYRGITYGYERTLTVAPGKHEVCTYAINVAKGISNTHLGCKSVSADPLGTFVSQPAPTIAGVAQVDETLSAGVGIWAPTPSISLQWKANGVAIVGATQQQLKVTNAMVGKKITVVATASLSGYSTAARSSAATSAVVPLANFALTPPPSVRGTPTVGTRLQAFVASWSPLATKATLSWSRDGQVIPGATGSSYLLTAADQGKIISLSIVGTRPGYAPLRLTSAPTLQVAGQTLTSTPTPKIAGSAAVGTTVSVQAGAWAPQPIALSYQWLRGGVPIAGANATRYRVTTSDVNSAITVSVTGSRAGYASVQRTSLATPRVPALMFTSVPAPKISGEASVGRKLTVSSGASNPIGELVSYQWKRAGGAIKGATATSYSLTAQDVGQKITVVATTSRVGYATTMRESAASLPVSASHFSVAPAPTLTGAPVVGRKLTATVKGWNPQTISADFVWMRNGARIPGAVGMTYVATPADAQAAISVAMTGSRPGYVNLTRTSAASAPVALAKFGSVQVPKINGQATIGSELSAVSGSWAPAGVALAFQWNRNGAIIAGATNSRYLLTSKDAGAVITVTVTGTKAGFVTEAKTSSGLTPK